uniref:Mesothelin n=1 Tax=Chelonoidis abingdonii TaxID=106734 RepID=A0A8C0J9Z4_CHEAB
MLILEDQYQISSLLRTPSPHLTCFLWIFRLSPSVLQGFICAAANEMETERFQQLAKAMKQKNVKLGEDQVSPYVHRVPRCCCHEDVPRLSPFTKNPPTLGTGSCQQYFSNVGEANIDLLQRDSPQRKQLLAEALACLKIPGTTVSEENAEILGHLVCDLGEEYIRSSSGSLLLQLNECESFMASQEEAIRNVLSSGSTQFGPPSKWSASTLNELSGLFPLFGRNILQKIPQVCYKLASCCFLKCPRCVRECPEGKMITEEVVKDELMPIYYTPEELQACLQGVTLVDHLDLMAQYPFTDQQLAVLKKKLDELYPNGYPEKILPNLGAISSFVTADDIKKWNITSEHTLAFLLSNEPPDEQVNSWQLSAYLFIWVCLCRLGTVCPSWPHSYSHTAQSLNIWGQSHPWSDSVDFQGIARESLWVCLRTLAVLSGFASFCFFPIPAGAPGEDLRALSKDNVNMDIGIFMSLKKDSVLVSLTSDDIKGLLGLNLEDLKKQQYNSPVKDWIRLQRQSDLDKLGIGLTGGIPDGYISIPPKFEAFSRTSVSMFHLLPALLLSILLTSFLS